MIKEIFPSYKDLDQGVYECLCACGCDASQPTKDDKNDDLKGEPN